MSLKWGIVSAGLISQDFCTVLRTLDSSNHEILAVAARKLDDAKAFSERFNIKNAYDSYDKLYEDNEVNIVYVGNVNSGHKDACLGAIRNGKHVLCEKPMTLNRKEQEEVLTAAKEKNVFFMEGLWTRFFPAIERLREELKSNTIGEVKVVQANFYVNISKVERVKSKELGGGGVIDIGIYPLQFALMVFNHEKPIEIKSTGFLASTGVDETVVTTLKFSNQRVAIVSCSITGPAQTQPFGTATVIGEKGFIQITNHLWCPTELIINGEKFEFPIPNNHIKTNFANSMGFRYEIEAVQSAISQGLKEHPYVTHDDSRLIMSILDEERKQVGYILNVD